MAQTKNKSSAKALPADKYGQYSGCQESKDILAGRDPNVVCLIRRYLASNAVVYRARTITGTDADGTPKVSLCTKKPIEVFWLKLTRDDLRKHREAGKADDRVELSKIERKVAYGVTCKKDKIKKSKTSRWAKVKAKRKRAKAKKAKQNQTPTSGDDDITTSTAAVDDDSTDISYKVHFNALKSMNMSLRLDADSRPGLYGKIEIDDEEVECRLESIWVTLKTGRMGIPKVDTLTVKANRCDTNEAIEHIMRK